MADDFLTTYAPLANDISGQTGLNPATVLGIIDTETGHGRHVLGNNIFGISPGGRVAQYPDVQTASQAFVGLMRQPNYAPAAAVTELAAQAQLLVRGGYNTVNPKYAATVAASAQNAVKQLGYQDGTGDQTAQASAPDYNNPPPPGPPAAASPPAQPQQGSAKDRVLSDPALNAGGGSSAAPAASAKDRVLADPALQTTTTGTTKTTAAAPSLPPVSEYGDVGPDAWFNKSATPPPAASALPTKQDVSTFLAPAPNTTYGDIVPLAKDNTTGAIRLALPNIIRNPLIGLTEQGPGTDGTFGSSGVTWNPQTQTYGLTPEAASVGQFAATPLRFSGPNALVREPPSMLTQMGVTKPLPVTLPELNAAIARAGPEPPPAQPTPAPSGGPGAGASGSPQPTAAGAEATTAPIPEKTPVQAQRDLEASVAQTAADRAGPQMQDHNVYVPGVQRTLAEREFTPQNALDEKVSMADPAFRQHVEAIKKDNNEAMVDLLRKDAGDKITLDDAYTAREAVAPDALALFRDETPVDAAPIVKQIDDILAGPSGKRAAVRNTLGNVRAELFDSDGNLETMPSQLYGARQNITDLLKKGAKGTSEQAGDVQVSKAHLESLLEPLDETINGGAPRYQQYLNDFRAASQPINQMEYLQQFQPSGARNIAGPGGNPTFNKVNGMLSQIARDRAARGVNKAKSLTEDQIQNVIAVRNELAAVDLKERLAAVKGSDTFQQLQRAGETGSGPVGTAVKGLAGLGAEGLAHALLAPTTGGAGNALLAGGAATYRFAIRPAMRKAAENRQAKAVADAVAARRAALLETQPSSSAAP